MKNSPIKGCPLSNRFWWVCDIRIFWSWHRSFSSVWKVRGIFCAGQICPLGLVLLPTHSPKVRGATSGAAPGKGRRPTSSPRHHRLGTRVRAEDDDSKHSNMELLHQELPR